MRIMNTMLLIFSVPCMISLRRSIDIALRCIAISIAPIAPTPAASVGVAKPPRIEPRTANMRISGGASADRMRSRLTFSSLVCAGIADGLIIAVTTR